MATNSNPATNLAAAVEAYGAAILALRDAYVELKACDLVHEQKGEPGYTLRGSDFEATIRALPESPLYPLPHLELHDLDALIQARFHALMKGV